MNLRNEAMGEASLTLTKGNLTSPVQHQPLNVIILNIFTLLLAPQVLLE